MKRVKIFLKVDPEHVEAQDSISLLRVILQEIKTVKGELRELKRQAVFKGNPSSLQIGANKEELKRANESKFLFICG